MPTHPQICTIRFLSLVTTIVAAIASANSVHAQQAFFMGLGYLSGLDGSSRATDVSGDGSIVVGTIDQAGGGRREFFRWTRGTGMVGVASTYFDDVQISNDGSTIVGQDSASYFRWRESTGKVPLPSAANSQSWLAGLNSDGSMIALAGRVWTESGGLVPSPNNMVIRDISTDGLSFVGYQGSVAPASGEGYIWSAQDGVTVLGPPYSDGAYFWNPRRISSDGKVVVGHGGSASTNNLHNFRWTKETGLIDFGNLRVDVSPNGTGGISGDGSVIVAGDSIWRTATGTQSLIGVLINEFGLAQQLDGWRSLSARSISADGRSIVGQGRNPAGKDEAWIAYLGTPVPEPSTLLLAAIAIAPFAWRRRGVPNRAHPLRMSPCGSANWTLRLEELHPGTLPASFP